MDFTERERGLLPLSTLNWADPFENVSVMQQAGDILSDAGSVGYVAGLAIVLTSLYEGLYERVLHGKGLNELSQNILLKSGLAIVAASLGADALGGTLNDHRKKILSIREEIRRSGSKGRPG